ncbi:MAG: hypothetical protein EZS26_001988 [Candidatus Ordinivivax streblomastigis]|uniref:SbsA Ig-like domain-containing protein n=1 Tax=Candidatus Ordinivivax streblomastigis TaxID=2540710 RepID=A0A5M8P066_9BACT|nr:MAG: hypothetical protein EZS26_001988 [Candidatus Ordinivivax streblomastigis]
MKKIYLFLTALFMCGITFAQTVPVSEISPGQKYNIKHVATGLYLNHLENNDDGDFNVNVLLPGESAFEFEFTAVSGLEATYNVGVDGGYIGGTNWNIQLQPTITETANTRIILLPNDDGSLQLRAAWQSDNVISLDNHTVTAPGSRIYANKTSGTNSKWVLETAAAVPATVKVVSTSPITGAVGVDVAAPLVITFNKRITLLTADGITIGSATGNATASANVLTITHAQLEFDTDYTVTIPKGTINDFDEVITFSFRTAAEPVLPSGGKRYTIQHSSGLYLTANTTTVVLGAELTNDLSQIFTFTDAAGEGGNFNIATQQGFLYNNGGWTASFKTALEDVPNEKIKASISGAYTTLRALSRGANEYFGRDNATSTSVYFNKGLDLSLWTLKELQEPDAIVVLSTTPEDNAPKVAQNAKLSAVFNTVVNPADLSGITINGIPVNVANISVIGTTLTIAHAAFDLDTQYTVVIPTGTITGYDEAITWTFKTAAPVVLANGKKYNLKHVQTGYYLTLNTTAPVAKIAPATGDEDQIVELVVGDGFYNLGVLGQYLAANGYSPALSTDPANANSKFELTHDGLTTKIQSFAYQGTTKYFSPQNTASGSTSFMDSDGNDVREFWAFEEIVEPAELLVKTLTPIADAVNVSNTAVISILFNKAIAKTNLSGITILNADATAVAGVAGTIAGSRLNITYSGELAYGKTYTVTVPENAIEGFATPITWSFTIANPVLPQEPRSYNIKNSKSGLYLTLSGLTLTVAAKNNAATQIFSFSNPDPTNLNVFDIAVDGKYVAKEGSNAWTLTLLADPAATSQFEVIPEGVGIKFRALSNAATEFLGPNNNDGTGDVYLNKAVSVVWELEEVDVPLAIYKRFPSVSETNVAINAAVKAQFNKDITASDLETVTIKYGENSVVTGVVATAAGATISIAHDDFAFSTTYTVTIPAAVVGLEAEKPAFSWSFTTEAAPAITSITPTDNATDVAIAANTAIKVDFDKTVLPGEVTGVKISANSTDLEDVVATVSGTSLTITHPVLDYSTVYTVTVPAVAVKGLVRDTVWSFTTTAAPTKRSTLPLENAVNVQLNTQIRVTFDKAPVAGSAGLAGVTLTSADAPNENLARPATVSGSNLSITKAANVTLKNRTVYTVTVPANTIKGVTEEIKWSFTTVAGTGIEDIYAENVVVYPTVSKGNLTVTTPGNASVKVVDVSGRTLANYHSNGNLNIDLNYANGLYIIQVDDNGSVSSHKVILKK